MFRSYTQFPVSCVTDVIKVSFLGVMFRIYTQFPFPTQWCAVCRNTLSRPPHPRVHKLSVLSTREVNSIVIYLRDNAAFPIQPLDPLPPLQSAAAERQPQSSGTQSDEPAGCHGEHTGPSERSSVVSRARSPHLIVSERVDVVGGDCACF